LKASAITIGPAVALRRLPPPVLAVLREFFTRLLVGSDPVSHRRWIRLVREIFEAGPGTAFQLYRVEGRSGKFHALHRAILTAIFERQEIYPHRAPLHDFLKLRCWFVEWVDGKPTPRGTDFDTCSEDEIREFNARLQHLLYEPEIQSHLWPHLSERLRLENVTAILTNPKEEPHEQC
jgi:hypothetical protein